MTLFQVHCQQISFKVSESDILKWMFPFHWDVVRETFGTILEQLNWVNSLKSWRFPFAESAHLVGLWLSRRSNNNNCLRGTWGFLGQFIVLFEMFIYSSVLELYSLISRGACLQNSRLEPCNVKDGGLDYIKSSQRTCQLLSISLDTEPQRITQKRTWKPSKTSRKMLFFIDFEELLFENEFGNRLDYLQSNYRNVCCSWKYDALDGDQNIVDYLINAKWLRMLPLIWILFPRQFLLLSTISTFVFSAHILDSLLMWHAQSSRRQYNSS